MIDTKNSLFDQYCNTEEDLAFWEKYEEANGGYQVRNFGTGRHFLEVMWPKLLNTNFLTNNENNRIFMRKAIQKGRDKDYQTLEYHLAQNMNILPDGNSFDFENGILSENTNLGTIYTKESEFLKVLWDIKSRYKRVLPCDLKAIPDNIDKITDKKIAIRIITPEDLKEYYGLKKAPKYMVIDSVKMFEEFHKKFLNRINKILNPSDLVLNSFYSIEKQKQVSIDKSDLEKSAEFYLQNALRSGMDFHTFLDLNPPNIYLTSNFESFKEKKLVMTGDIWKELYGDLFPIDFARSTIIPLTQRSMDKWSGKDENSGEIAKYRKRTMGLITKFERKKDDGSITFGMAPIPYIGDESSYGEGKLSYIGNYYISQFGSKSSTVTPHYKYSNEHDEETAKVVAKNERLFEMFENSSKVLPVSKRFKYYLDKHKV